MALAGWRAGKSLRELAAELYGRGEVEACWNADSPMRARMRLLLSRAGARAGAGTDAEREADSDPDLPRCRARR